MASSGMIMNMASVSIGAIVGIAIGCSVLIGLLVVGGFFLIYRWKHKRHSNELERNIGLTHEVVSVPQPAYMGQAHASRRLNMHNAEAAWGRLSSNDDLAHPNSVPPMPVVPTLASDRTQKKGGRLFRGPSKKKAKGGRDVAMKNMKPSTLSVIFERSPKVGLRSPKQTMQSSLAQSVGATQAGTFREPGTLASHDVPSARARDSSPSPDVFPSAALRPEPLQIARPSINKKPVAGLSPLSAGERCFSEPSILGSGCDAPFAPNHSRNRASLRQERGRSVSLSSQHLSSAPGYPPPPVPANIVERPTIRPVARREFSSDSVSSHDTCDSSILLREITTPSMKARNEFSQRNPDLQLGAQIREVDEDMAFKQDLLPISRPDSRQSDHTIRSLKRKDTSAHERSLPRVSEARVSDLPGFSKGFNFQLSLGPDVSSANRSSVRTISADDITKPNRKSRRQSLAKSASASGSPLERPRTSALRPISGNRANMLRNTSQTSTQSSSNRSSVSNPFHMDPTYVNTSGKPSAMKGSPTSRGLKRPTSVRFSRQGSGSPSSLNLNLIAEVSENGRLSESTDMAMPSAAHSEPGVTLKGSDRPEAFGSGSLSPPVPRHGDHLRATSPTPSRSHESARSSMLSLSNFPSIPPPGRHRKTETSSLVLRDNSDPKSIPGLSLINQPQTPTERPQFDFPCADELHPSPSRDGDDFISSTVERPSLPTGPSYSDLSLKPRPLRSVSPTPKSTATTELSHVETSPLPIRQVPIGSNLNPLTTKPHFLPPNDSMNHPLSLPAGQSEAQAQSLFKSVQSLRRMRSSKLDISGADLTMDDIQSQCMSREDSIALEDSSARLAPKNSPWLIAMADADDEVGGGKENAGRWNSDGTVKHQPATTNRLSQGSMAQARRKQMRPTDKLATTATPGCHYGSDGFLQEGY